MAKEVEIKFELEPAQKERLRALSFFGRWSASQPSRKRLVSVYYDTSDLALRSRGVGFRVRSVGERWVQTLKTDRGGSGFFKREEHETPVEGNRPDFEALRGSAFAFLRDDASLRDRLRPVFTTDFEREKWLLTRGGTRVEMALDEGSVYTEQAATPLFEVELELVSGEQGLLFLAALELAESLPLRLETISKAARGYRLIEPHRDEPVSVGEERVADLDNEPGARASLNRLLHGLRANEAALAGSGAAQAAVNIRRALAQMRACLGGPSETASPAIAVLRDDYAWAEEAWQRDGKALFQAPRYTSLLLRTLSWLHED